MAFFRDLFERKSHLFGIFNLSTSGVPLWPKRNFRQLATEGYQDNPVAYACVNEIGLAISGIPWKAYRKTRSGQLVELRTHPILDFISRPNIEQSFGGFNDEGIRDYLISGDEYCLLVDDEGILNGELTPITQAPRTIWHIQPGSLKAIPDDYNQLAYWEVPAMGFFSKLFGKSRKIHPSRIIHRKTYNPLDRFFGMSPLLPAAHDIDTLNMGLWYNYNLLKNSGRPEGVILIKGKATPEKQKEAQAQLDEAFSDPKNSGRFKALYGMADAELKQFSLMPKDMEFQKGRSANALSICTVLNVPPEIIGIGQKTYSNYAEAREAFYLEGVLPHMDRIEESYNRQLCPLFDEKVVLKYDKDSIEALQEDRDQRHARARDDYKAGVATANEAREAVGRPPVDDEYGDVRMVPLSQVPIDELVSSKDFPDGQNPNPDPNGAQGGAGDQAGEGDGGESGDNPDAEGGGDTPKSAAVMTPLFMTTAASPAQAFKSFDRKRLSWTKVVSKAALRVLKNSYEEVAKAISALDEPEQMLMLHTVERALKKSEPQWAKFYVRTYSQVGMDFAASVTAGLDEALVGKAIQNAIERRSSTARAEWAKRISEYVAREAGKKIVGISRTSRDRIAARLAAGLAAGDGIDQLAASVRELAGGLQGRANTIARTEVISSSNLGSDAAARSYGIPLRKGWLAVIDGRERETHAEASDTEVVSLDEPFKVGDSLLMFPGDTSLGAEPKETINCRCTQIYEPA